MLAVFGSVTTYLTNRWIDGWRKKDAFNRLLNEPTIFVGARLHRILDSSSGVALIGPLSDYRLGCRAYGGPISRRRGGL